MKSHESHQISLENWLDRLIFIISLHQNQNYRQLWPTTFAQPPFLYWINLKASGRSPWKPDATGIKLTVRLPHIQVIINFHADQFLLNRGPLALLARFFSYFWYFNIWTIISYHTTFINCTEFNIKFVKSRRNIGWWCRGMFQSLEAEGYWFKSCCYQSWEGFAKGLAQMSLYNLSIDSAELSPKRCNQFFG